MSRNGCARSFPFTSTRITPGCSTTYSFPGSLRGAPTKTGESKPEANTRMRS